MQSYSFLKFLHEFRAAMARSKKGMKNPLQSSGVQHTANTEDNPLLTSATAAALGNTPSASVQRHNSIVQAGNTVSRSVITDPGDASIPTRDNVCVEQALELEYEFGELRLQEIR